MIEKYECRDNRTIYRWVDLICWAAAVGLILGAILMGA